MKRISAELERRLLAAKQLGQAVQAPAAHDCLQSALQ